MALQFPAAYGGDGADALACAILIEEIARVCASSSLMALISKLALTPVTTHGSRALQQRYLPAVASGASQASYCLSETGAGSDVASISMTARRDGDSYVLQGSKFWITNTGVSDLYTVFAKTDPAAGHRGISCFVVEPLRSANTHGSGRPTKSRDRLWHGRDRCNRLCRRANPKEAPGATEHAR